MSAPPTILVFIDADACPVKDEVYRVTGRHGVKTIVVSNSYMQLPRDPHGSVRGKSACRLSGGRLAGSHEQRPCFPLFQNVA